MFKKLAAAIAACLALSSQIFAISPNDLHAILYDTNFYDANSGGACSIDSVASSTNLPSDVINRINQLKDIYVQAATQDDLPWQVLAAIHYREANNDPNSDLQAGNPFGGGTQYSTQGAQTDLLSSAVNAGQLLQQKAQDGLFHTKITADNPNPEVIKDALYGYNGRAQVYADQAASLGFDPKTQPYEGSPYVMNEYDTIHTDMKIVTKDFGSLDGIDTRYGAFTVYSRLSGDCGGGGDGTIVGIAISQIGTHESPDGCNCGGGIQPDGHTVDSYTDGHPEFWCADFVSWVYNKAGKPFTGGDSGGWRIAGVSALMSWFQQNGVFVARQGASVKPQPGDVIFFTYDSSSNDTNSGDHTGIVESVDGNTINTIEGNSSNGVNRRSYDLSNNSTINGWGRLK